VNGTRPNVLLLFADQWRGDCLSIDGHPVVETPCLDWLASRGRRFTRAYSATPTCLPARAALMTGLSPATHRRVGYREGVPWAYRTTLAGEFTSAGYRTHAIGKMHVYPPRERLGFQAVQLHDGYLHATRGQSPEPDDYLPWLREVSGREDAEDDEHGVDCNSVIARPWDKPEWQHPTNWVTQQAVRFLRSGATDGSGGPAESGREPFFLFVSYHRPHPPYDPPAWAFEQYLRKPMPDPPAGAWSRDWWGAGARPSDPTWPYLELSQDRLDRARAGYYGHMSHIDLQIHRLLQVLAEQRLADNTIVLFSSDHGELMGDHNLFRKSLPYEGSARVPLILAGPGVTPGADDRLAELRDIMPTLLDLAGLPVPDAVEGLPLTGSRAREFLHGEHIEHVITAGRASVQWITDGDWKYIWRSDDGREQLFCLRTDPHELRDLTAAEPAQAARLRALLIAGLADRPEGFVQDGTLVPGRPVAAVLPD
jgi:arylsulfatase